MRKYKKIENTILETICVELRQAANALDSKATPERYKIDFAISKMNHCRHFIEQTYLKNELTQGV